MKNSNDSLTTLVEERNLHERFIVKAKYQIAFMKKILEGEDITSPCKKVLALISDLKAQIYYLKDEYDRLQTINNRIASL